MASLFGTFQAMKIFKTWGQRITHFPPRVARVGLCSLIPLLAFTLAPCPAIATETATKPEPVKEHHGEPKTLDNETELIPFEEAIADREKKEGLFTLYYEAKKHLVSAEIKPGQLDKIYLLQSSLSQGLGQFGLYRGMPLDNLTVTLHRVENTLQVTVPNSLFRSISGDVTHGRENEFFSDSVVLTLPIISIQEGSGNLLVDLDPLFTTASPVFQDLSTWVGFLGYTPGDNFLKTVQAFPLNLEFDTRYQFNGGSADTLLTPMTVPNPAAFSLGVHYSLSEIVPNPNFRPRPADERVGYFITTYWDLSKRRDRNPFVRYINRWDLEKQDPKATLSPPKKPIVFWLENTLPPEYRDAARRGVLAWNEAFEKLGFKEAIQVKQMPDHADWDPADVRYNTIRWTTSVDGGFAFGPSRVNPYTGEILDTDIIVDENYIRFNVNAFQNLMSDPLGGGGLAWSRMTQDPRICDARLGMMVLKNPKLREKLPHWNESMFGSDRCYGQEAQQNLALGALSLSLGQNILPSSPEMKKFLEQAVQDVVSHEVGHTLGLRHNFHGSTALSPEELADPKSDGILSSSVMDYLPPNLAAPGQHQGDFFPTGIGKYDEWAIAYGYTPMDPNLSTAEVRQRLKTIADQSIHYSYGTDEDAFTDLDPGITLFDLSNDPLTYNLGQMNLAANLWQKLDQRYPTQGESYSEGRDAFNTVFFHYIFNAYQLTRYVGGRSVTRYLGGDTPDRYPLEPITVQQQRQALKTIGDRVFRAEVFNFPPTLMRKLTPARWLDWASNPFSESVEYPLADRILNWQTLIMADLFAPDRLARLRDTALQYPGTTPLTLPELFGTVQTAIWNNYLNFDRHQTEIPLLQRRLQDQNLTLLIDLNQEGYQAIENATTFPEFLLAVYSVNAPREARSVARYSLEDLKKRLAQAQREDHHLDMESQLHLKSSYDRIAKALKN